MTKDQAERVWVKVQTLGQAGVELSDKEVDVLGKILGSEPMLKAMASVYAIAHRAPEKLLAANLEDPQQRMEAIRLQGFVIGIVNTLETLFTLATEKEEELTDADDQS